MMGCLVYRTWGCNDGMSGIGHGGCVMMGCLYIGHGGVMMGCLA